jgi:hypothetical protein
MLKIIGIVLLCIFAALDASVRIRLKGIGRKWVFLRGGTLDYGEYLRVREQYAWPAWPVYVIWATLIAGLVLFFAAVIWPNS